MLPWLWLCSHHLARASTSPCGGGSGRRPQPPAPRCGDSCLFGAVCGRRRPVAVPERRSARSAAALPGAEQTSQTDHRRLVAVQLAAAARWEVKVEAMLCGGWWRGLRLL